MGQNKPFIQLIMSGICCSNRRLTNSQLVLRSWVITMTKPDDVEKPLELFGRRSWGKLGEARKHLECCHQQNLNFVGGLEDQNADKNVDNKGNADGFRWK